VPATVRDPIHGSIPLDDWVLPLLDTAVVQRLRRVRQLGTAHLVYPGATHTRFEHGLGAHHLAGLLVAGLGAGREGSPLTADDARTVRAAALLHDVGHGPFSHAFEELVRDEGRRHEQVSVDLIRWGPLGDLLRRAGLDPVAVADAVVGQGRLAPIVSGTLDADRMDYLLRDAHHTGLPTSVDPQRLADVVAHHPEHGVVLQASGVPAAEALLTMRFLMYPSVYLHHTVRASESMLLEAVRAHIRDGHATLRDLERETDDGLMWRIRQAGGTGGDLVQRLWDRRLYKRAFEGTPEQADAPLVQEMQRSTARRQQVAAEIADAAGVAHHEVLVDVPRPTRFRELGLMVLHRDGRLETLAEASRLVAVLQEARMDHWRFWAFTPKAHRERVSAAAARVLGAAPSVAV
jgi:uncharacterized protein